jgi:uncharacterized iron-regulated membrane protein
LKTGSIAGLGLSYIKADATLVKQSTPRRKLFKLHSWVGFHLALIMSLILATGTIATIANEIDWIVHKELRVTPLETRVAWQKMTDAIKAYSPESTILTIEQLEGDYLANRARVKNTDGSQRYIYVDQWTGQVTGATGTLTVQRFFRDLHRYMFMPNVIGLPIVTSMAFILGISLYTGLKTSRNWKTLMTRIRITKGARVMVGDAHKAFGLWAVWFLVLMIITSVWYLAEFGAALGGKRFEPSRPNVSVEQLESYGATIKSPSTNDIISAAKEAYPELVVTTISFPARANQAITVLGDNGNPILRSRANRVFLDPQTLEPLKVQRSGNIGWIAWLNEIADPLHFGFFGGLITKLIWFIFGLALTSLSVTGVWLTWQRSKTKAISKAQFATMPVLIIALLFGYFWWYQRYTPVEKPVATNVLKEISNASISVEPALWLNENQQRTGIVRFHLTTKGGRPNLKKSLVTLTNNVREPVGESKPKLEILSELSVIRASFNQDEIKDAKRLTLTLELNTGQSFDYSWRLESINSEELATVKALNP